MTATQYILLSELARRTRHSRTSLLNWEKRGAIPPRVHHGGRKFFRVDELPHWLRQKLEPATQKAMGAAPADAERIAA
jgi:hypothetical protein